MNMQDRPQPVPVDLVSIPAAAHAVGLPAATLSAWIRQGRVAVSPGQRRRLVNLRDVQALVAPPGPDTPADAVALYDAIRRTGVSRTRLVAWVTQGRLPLWRGPHGRLVRVADVRALAEHAVAGGDTPPPADALLVREAARRSGLSTARLYAWMKQGLLPAWRGVEGRRRVHLADVIALAERQGRGLPLKPVDEP